MAMGRYLKIIQKTKSRAEQVDKRISSEQWRAGWHEVDAMAKSVSRKDPRYEVVLAWLDHADTAYLRGDHKQFEKAVKFLKMLIQHVQPGS
jgi:hypothetical protein